MFPVLNVFDYFPCQRREFYGLIYSLEMLFAPVVLFFGILFIPALDEHFEPFPLPHVKNYTDLGARGWGAYRGLGQFSN